MSVIIFPSMLPVLRQSWIQQRNDVEFRSMFGAQAIEATGPLWSSTITAPTDLASLAGPWQSLMMQLRGRVNQLALWNLGRPYPLGTMRGSMVFASDAPAGSTVLNINSPGQAYTTLLAGDYVGMGGGAGTTNQQVVMNLFDAVADGSGNITITVEPPLRNLFPATSYLSWNHPCALFRRKSSTIQWDYEPLVVSGLMLDLLEDVRP
jgi:hypothetical protein